VRKLKGEPGEKNITILYDEAAELLGKPLLRLNSKDTNHLPAPSEMKDEGGKFIIPNKPCPNCGKSAFLMDICPACKDSENGKYHSGYKCDERVGGCGHISDKSEKTFLRRMRSEFPDIAVPSGYKLSLGIKTVTDDGIK
jgi:hypothetical protein